MNDSHKSDPEFMANPNICLVANKTCKSTFRIMPPYDNTMKTNLPLRVGFNENWTDKMLILDQRLTMVLDVLLTAKALDIDLKKYAGTKTTMEFFNAFNADITKAENALQNKFKKPVDTPLDDDGHYIDINAQDIQEIARNNDVCEIMTIGIGMFHLNDTKPFIRYCLISKDE